MSTTRPSTQKGDGGGWRTFLLKSRAEITGDSSATRRVPDQSQVASAVARRAHVHRSGRPHLREDHGREHQAPLRDHPRQEGRSAPVIQTRIAGGHATITLGSNDPEISSATRSKLELVLRSGALPAPITPRTSSTSALARRDAIRLASRARSAARARALVHGHLLHARRLIADIAVAMNLFLQLAVLASFNASMTLPASPGSRSRSA
jgi:preprotein translocase subunit SecD